MPDIRLKTFDLTLGGKTYSLCCNFAVLADVDYSHGGVQKTLNVGSFAATLTFLTAMLNDFERRVGSGVRYSKDEVSDLLAEYSGTAADLVNQTMDVVLSAVTGGHNAESDTESGPDEKN